MKPWSLETIQIQVPKEQLEILDLGKVWRVHCLDKKKQRVCLIKEDNYQEYLKSAELAVEKIQREKEVTAV